jgi:membrane associated rhomboid family serine protease
MRPEMVSRFMEQDRPSPVQPWNDPSSFPVPTLSCAYGYRKGGKDYPASKSSLMDSIETDAERRILLVWTPESPGMVPPEEVSFLESAVAVRNDEHLFAEFKSALVRGVPFYLPAFAGLAAGRGFGQVGLFLITVSLLEPLVEIGLEWWSQRRMDPAQLQDQAANSRYQYWLSRQEGAYVTYSIVALIAAVGICQIRFGLQRSVDVAGLVKPAVRGGDVERLLSAAFLHGSILHFGYNQVALLGLGRQVEALAHRTYVPIVFLISAITASLFSLVLLPDVTSVGASGGIMGLLGFLLVLVWRNRRDLPSLLLNTLARIVLWTMLAGLVGYSVIDNAGHAGGLLAGLALGLFVFRRRGQRFHGARHPLAGYVVGAACLAVLVACATWMVRAVSR